jgi:GLPGLI family protein
MKKTILFVILPIMLSGQSESVPIGRIIYSQIIQTPGDKYNNGNATLLFNSLRSTYTQNGAPTKDSIIISTGFFSETVAGDPEGFPIYKLHQERKILFKVSCGRLSKVNCVVSDTFGTIVWTFLPEHKRFGQYTCSHATGEFRGREYDVWYTPDIPISSGPFKLGGLPGLILEAQSTDGAVKYLFNLLDISSTLPGMILPPNGNYLNIDYADFIKGELKVYENMVNESKAQGFEISISRQQCIELNTDN